MKVIIVLLLLSCTVLSGQSSFVSAGQSTSGLGEESVSYSIGQVFYQSARDDTTPDGFSVTDGVQQPFEIRIQTVEEDDPLLKEFPQLSHSDTNFEKETELSFQVFPNPFTSQVTINLEGSADNVTAMISDAQGRLVFTQNIFSEQTNLELSAMGDGLYYLTVTKNNSPIQSFKLFKQSN